MYNKILSVLSCLWIVWGTILSILCILKMSLKDVWQTRTAGHLDTAELDVLEQRYYARRGIGIIIVGTILQIVTILFDDVNSCCFWVATILTVAITCIIFIGEGKKYNRDKEDLNKSNLG